MFSSIRNIWTLLDRRRIRSFYVVLAMVFVSSLLELLGVGLIIPILSLMTSESSQSLEFINSIGLTVPGLILLTGSLFLFKNVFVGATLFKLYQLSYGVVADVRKRLHHLYVSQLRAESLSKHNSVKIKNVGENADRLGRHFIVPLVQMLSEGSVLLFLLLYAGVKLPSFFLLQIAVGAAVIGSVVWFIKRYVTRWGERVNRSYENVIKIAKENIEGARELKLYKAADLYTEKFTENVKLNSHNQALFYGVNNVPKLTLEVGVISLLLIMMASAYMQSSSVNDLVLFGVILIRVYPSFSRVVSCANTLHFGESVLREISELLSEQHVGGVQPSSIARRPIELAQRSLERDALVFSGIDFSYPNAQSSVFDDLNLVIRPGVTGLVGGSGAGKSTLLDLLMGISIPVDGEIVYVENGAYQEISSRRVSFVAQKPHIFDGTIAENIALGLPAEDQDEEKIWRVLEIVSLTPLVKGLKDGLNEYVGEHAGFFSGGEAQRLAIARALYFDPEILILDEATSALNTKLEARIVDWLAEESGIKYIIMSAHKLSSLKNADDIIVMEQGKIVGQGSWEKIEDECEEYRDSYKVA